MPGGPLPPKNFAWPPKNFSGLFLKVLHRPLTAPLVAKLAPPVAPQMKMFGSAPDRCRTSWAKNVNSCKRFVSLVQSWLFCPNMAFCSMSKV